MNAMITFRELLLLANLAGPTICPGPFLANPRIAL
jgi:hypothetical protein